MLNLLGNGVQKLQDIHKKVEESFEQALQSNESSAPGKQGFTHESANGLIKVEPSLITPTSHPETDGISPGHVARNDKTMKEFNDLKSENQRLSEECTRIAKRLAVVEDKHRERFKELEGIMKSKKDLEGRLKQTEEKLLRSGEDGKRLESQIRVEQDRYSKLQSEINLLKKESPDSSRQEVLAADLVRAQEDKAALVQVVRSLEVEAERLRLYYTDRLNLLTSENAQLTKYTRELEEKVELEALDIASANWTNPLSVAITQEKVPIIDDEAIKSTNDHLINALEAEIRSLKEKNSEQTVVIADLETQLHDQSTVLTRTEARLAAAESVRKSLSESLEVEITKSDRLAAELTELRIQNRKLINDLSDSKTKTSTGIEAEADRSSACDGDLRRKFELALQAIGKLSDDLEDSRAREEELRRLLKLQ